MERKRLFCLLLAIITAILLLTLTIKFIPSLATVVTFLAYLSFTSVIFVSGLGIIQDRKSKDNWCGLLAGIDGIIMSIVFLIECFGEIDESMKIIALIIFMITFILFAILCGFWSKFEKNK